MEQATSGVGPRGEKMDLETQITQALARGYCHPKNSAKEVDADLIEAMVKEVVESLTPAVQPGHK
jgi:hypothetical protein